MYQANILRIPKREDTSVFYAGDMNVHTLECGVVDGKEKCSIPPPSGYMLS